MPGFGLTRAAVDLRQGPALDYDSILSLPANTHFKLEQEQGDWLFIEVILHMQPQRGFIPADHALLTEDTAPSLEFRLMEAATSMGIPALPADLKPALVEAWLAGGGQVKPSWYPAERWNHLPGDDQQAMLADLRDFMQENQASWDAWLAEIRLNQRENDATLKEWFAILKGGQDMWVLRAEYLYQNPNSQALRVSSSNVKEIVKWNGHIRHTANEATYKDWYEVTNVKFGQQNQGWFKARLLAEYIPPTPLNDPADSWNAQNVFNLTHSLVRILQDPAVLANAGVRAAQYIDVSPVIGGPARWHYNLCGECCVAALGGMDLIPFLRAWHAAYPRADIILRNNLPTGIPDLESMLEVIGIDQTEAYRFDTITPMSPQDYRDRLRQGCMLICGVGIKSNGRVDPEGTIAHWVVIEDALPVSNSGWMRMYNPFNNREEVYTYDVFRATSPTLSAGLWLDHPRHG
jgi:hypothetical protein